ncbi:hypothetical protein [Photobacterium kishitanii]|uniref:hypothetical protein n=1 Tax=Photobacterium kishitanii TaxID=318456 RepID=UPI000D179CD9|nr:hypothetical protein [Photobacterium kishitanii]PSU23835.1 hypothetical protein CTM84_02705 [Photobacterium kishitanii]
MNFLVEKKNRLFGFIIKNGIKVGSCVPFKFNDAIYIITCGHVLYGTKLSDEIDSEDKMEVNTAYGSYPFLNIISDKDFSSKYDLAIVKICADTDKGLFLELEFSSLSKNPLLIDKFTLITKQFDDDHLSNIKPLIIEKTDLQEKFNYIAKFEKDTFLDHYISSYAVDAFKGISGSGIFYNTNDKIVLSGVIRSLDTSKLHSYGTFIEASLISDILCGVTIFDINQLDENRTIISQILNDCIDKTHEESISNWIGENSQEAKHIVRKMTTLYGKNEIAGEVKKVVSNLLDGDRLVKNWQQNNNSIYIKYQESTYATTSNHLGYTVESKSKAQSAYRELLKQHRETLNESFNELDGHRVSLRESIIVANRDLSQWLAICDLDFEIE